MAIRNQQPSPPDAAAGALIDQEAIRQLHLAFMSRMESRAYESAAGLFAERALLCLGDVSAEGAAAIGTTLVEQYRHQQANSLQSAYRPNSEQQQDVVAFNAEHDQATGYYHVDVRITCPLRGDSMLAQMARLRGQVAVQHWRSALIDVSYVKARGEWKMASLRCLAS